MRRKKKYRLLSIRRHEYAFEIFSHDKPDEYVCVKSFRYLTKKQIAVFEARYIEAQNKAMKWKEKNQIRPRGKK